MSLKNLGSLNETSTMKNVFVNFNTPLPCSAAVEQVFSIGASVLFKNRRKMHDTNFENVLKLKCNKNLFEL